MRVLSNVNWISFFDGSRGINGLGTGFLDGSRGNALGTGFFDGINGLGTGFFDGIDGLGTGFLAVSGTGDKGRSCFSGLGKRPKDGIPTGTEDGPVPSCTVALLEEILFNTVPGLEIDVEVKLDAGVLISTGEDCLGGSWEDNALRGLCDTKTGRVGCGFLLDWNS